jgi:phenylpyruvate tautomerase PptA (4-oxalocrotonate tautomerase family)
MTTYLPYKVDTDHLPAIGPEVEPKEVEMPIYQCATSRKLSAAQKDAIAKEITRVHIAWTAAPEAFVNVVFSELPHGEHFLAGAVRKDGALINAIVRAGRTLETRQALLKAISAAWSRLTGQPERNLVLRVEEADPATIMEAGLILPRPGEEAAWFEKNKAVLAEAAPAAA